MHFLSHISHIPSAQQPCVARAYHVGQHRYIKLPSLQKDRAARGLDYKPSLVAQSSLTEWSPRLPFHIPTARHIVDAQYTVLH